jgi:hypothetical protein
MKAAVQRTRRFNVGYVQHTGCTNEPMLPAALGTHRPVDVFLHDTAAH